jgi:hypothetical protein
MLAIDERTARAVEVLDRFGVANRLQHVRKYIWRGGALRFQIQMRLPREPDVYYELEAHWDAPVLEPLAAAGRGIERAARPVPEGRWTRGTAGYRLRVGIDLGVPSAIYIKATTRLESFVPFHARPYDQVEHAIDADFAAYVNAFLSHCRPVPDAAQADAEQLHQLGLSI